MEPNLVPYSPILHRPPLRWPNGACVALWVVPNIEHYEYLPDNEIALTFAITIVHEDATTF